MKTLKKILIWGGTTLGLLVIVLIIHIYMVTQSAKPVHSNLYLARVDFASRVDSVQAAQIKSEVIHMDGISNCYFNIPEKTLVFGFYKDQQDADRVVASINRISSVKAERFIPSKEDLAGSCPAINTSSFTYKFGQLIKSVFS